MSTPAKAEDLLYQFYHWKCKFLLKQQGCLTGLGGFEQRGPDPACVDSPDLLDYILHDVPVVILSFAEFYPEREGLIHCPECKESGCVSHDGWEPALRTAVGLNKSIGVLSRRYKCTNKRRHSE